MPPVADLPVPEGDLLSFEDLCAGGVGGEGDACAPKKDRGGRPPTRIGDYRRRYEPSAEELKESRRVAEELFGSKIKSNAAIASSVAERKRLERSGISTWSSPENTGSV